MSVNPQNLSWEFAEQQCGFRTLNSCAFFKVDGPTGTLRCLKCSDVDARAVRARIDAGESVASRRGDRCSGPPDFTPHAPQKS